MKESYKEVNGALKNKRGEPDELHADVKAHKTNAHNLVHPATQSYSCTHTHTNTKEGWPFNHAQSDCINISQM